ncbi:MAG: NHL repeat-containing protein [Bacteroidota bacterium]
MALFLAGSFAHAQPAPTAQAPDAADSTRAMTPTVPSAVATFEDAVSLSADPTGRLYVVDAAAATITVLDAAGRQLATHGGPGSGDYGFFEPAGLDPTNGLALFVADLGNQRVQRFERDFRLVRSIPVEQPGEDGPIDRVEDVLVGDPRAVALSPTDELHVIDARSRSVLTYDVDRTFERSIGGFRDPVDLAVTDDGTLVVADRGRSRLVVYDTYGFRLRRLDLAEPPVALAFARGRLLVTTARAVRVLDLDGVERAVYPIPLPDPDDTLIGSALVDDHLFVLTATALYRYKRP